MKKAIIVGLLTVAAVAFAARDAFIELNNSPKGQWFLSGLYIGAAAKDPTSDTLNKVTYVLGKTATIDVANLAAAGCDVTNTTTLTGAAIGDVCIVSPSLSNAQNDNLTFTCQVTAANTIRLRVCASAADNADSDTYRFTVIGQGR